MPHSPLDQLRIAAESVRQQLQLRAYDRDAVRQLAGYIEEQRPQLTPSTRQGVIIALGAFLGECLVEGFGGQWASGPDGTTGIGLHENWFFNPFFRVAQQLEHGLAESVEVFYESVPEWMANPPQQKGWL
jgi:hypothetical protein